MDVELFPESIRGGWYLLPSEGDLEEALEESGAVVVFSLEGDFERFDLTAGERELDESGDYTFDGQFLILRGTTTQTFRVHPTATWRWELEGKKDDQVLLRGLTEHESPFELDTKRAKEIESVPARVFVRSEFGGPSEGEICSLIHESEGEELKLGACFAEPAEEGSTWIGVSSFVEGLSETLWERIVRRSYVEIYRDGALDDPQIELLR